MPRQTERETPLGQLKKLEAKSMLPDPKYIIANITHENKRESSPYPIFTSFFIRFADPDPTTQKPVVKHEANRSPMPSTMVD